MTTVVTPLILSLIIIISLLSLLLLLVERGVPVEVVRVKRRKR